MPEIILENIFKSFENGRITAVAGVNLKIIDGEYVFILGPSGCGKTTLLRIISGLTPPTSGRVLIDGQDVTEKSPQEREIAFVFQNFEIFPLTVWENVTYSLKVRGFPDEFIIKQGERALKIVGLEERADEFPMGWGNGDLQRVGLARAICSGAKILIMDEPLGSLDPKISAEFRWELRNIIKNNHLTAIQVTHNQEEAMNVGDRIIIMRGGNLLQESSPEHLYDFPVSIFVGNFLGGLNIIEGYVIHQEFPVTYHLRVRLGGPTFICKIFPYQKERFLLDEDLIVAFRYEDVYLFPITYEHANRVEWQGINLFFAEVKESFLTGKEHIFIIELENGDKIRVHKPEVFQYEFEIGERIKAGIFTEDMRLFKYPVNLEKEMDLQ